MSFIKRFIAAETASRRNFLLAGAYGITGAAALRMFGPSPIMAMTYSDPTIAWSYRNRTNPYWNEIVSGGEAFVESLGKSKDDLTHLINEGSSEKSLADVKALLAKTGGELALAIDTNDAPTPGRWWKPASRRVPLCQRSGTRPMTFTPGILVTIMSAT